MQSLRKDGPITIFAQGYAVSYGAYLLEEAPCPNFDCIMSNPLQLHYMCNNPESNLKFSLGVRAYHI